MRLAAFQERVFIMFERNVGGIDRVLRIVLGLALIAGFFLMPEASMRWLFLIGIVPLATGVFGTCALYSLLGINTCTTSRG